MLCYFPGPGDGAEVQSGVQQEARFGLAQLLADSGELQAAREAYETLLEDSAGASSGLREHLIHGEYGWMLFQNGDLEVGDKHDVRPWPWMMVHFSLLFESLFSSSK